MNAIVLQRRSSLRLADSVKKPDVASYVSTINVIRVERKTLVNLLILGRGKTGSLVAQVARERGHDVTLLCAADNAHAIALTPEKLVDVDAVIDFTTPQAVLANIEACVGAGKNMVVGTTGWYGDLETVRQLVDKSGTGFLYAANFSIGINLLFEAARTAAGILQHQYLGQIFERHHAQKKDAPSGTAATLQKIIRDTSASRSGNHLVPRGRRGRHARDRAGFAK